MKFIRLFSAILLLASAAGAQDRMRPVPYRPTHRHGPRPALPAKSLKYHPKYTYWNLSDRVSVHLTPSFLADYHGHLLAAGAEYYFNRNMGFSGEIGLSSGHRTFDTGSINRKWIRSDIRVSLELRHYFGYRKAGRLFAGLEGFYRSQHFTLENSYYREPGSYTSVSFSNSDVAKHVAGLGALFGCSVHPGAGILIEIYAGVGIKGYETYHTNIVSGYQSPQDIRFLGPGEDRTEGETSSLYLPFGVRIGWLIGGIRKPVRRPSPVSGSGNK